MKLRSDRPFAAGVAILGFVLVLVLLGPWLAPYGESVLVAPPFEPPTWQYLLGTDPLGRDVLSRLMNGGDVLFALSLTSLLLSYLVGVPLGLLAGFRGGLLDSAVQRVSEILIAFPGIIFVLLLIAGSGGSLWALILGIAAITAPRTAMVTRIATQELATRAFVERAITRGESGASIIFREILPNIRTTIISDACTRFAGTVTAISSLGFLGFGIQPPIADWSLMVNENRYALMLQPWAVLAPVVAIALLVVSLSLIGDGLAKAAALADPSSGAR